MKIRFDLSELEYERQMHRYWYGKFRIAMFIIGFLAGPYITLIVALIVKGIGK